MRKRVGKYAEEGLIGSLTIYPLQCTAVYQFGRVVATVLIVRAMHGVVDIVLQHLSAHSGIASLATIGIEEVGIVQMRLKLTHEAVIFVDATLVGSRDRAFVASSPLAKHTRSVAIVLHDFRENDMGGIVRLLSCLYGVLIVAIHHATDAVLLIATHPSMSSVLTCHK